MPWAYNYHRFMDAWLKEEAKGAIYSENNSEKRGRTMLKNQLVDGLKMSQVFMFFFNHTWQILGMIG